MPLINKIKGGVRGSCSSGILCLCVVHFVYVGWFQLDGESGAGYTSEMPRSGEGNGLWCTADVRVASRVCCAARRQTAGRGVAAVILKPCMNVLG